MVVWLTKDFLKENDRNDVVSLPHRPMLIKKSLYFEQQNSISQHLKFMNHINLLCHHEICELLSIVLDKTKRRLLWQQEMIVDNNAKF